MNLQSSFITSVILYSLHVFNTIHVYNINIIGQVRRHHPDVVLSVKTHQASRSVLNYQKEIVIKLHNLGLIEQVDEEILLEVHSKSVGMSASSSFSIFRY